VHFNWSFRRRRKAFCRYGRADIPVSNLRCNSGNAGATRDSVHKPDAFAGALMTGSGKSMQNLDVSFGSALASLTPSNSPDTTRSPFTGVFPTVGAARVTAPAQVDTETSSPCHFGSTHQDGGIATEPHKSNQLEGVDSDLSYPPFVRTQATH
jgi:hypothetical protein